MRRRYAGKHPAARLSYDCVLDPSYPRALMSFDYEHTFQFPFGERYQHRVIPYAKIEQEAPMGPGLYSWHFRLPRNEQDLERVPAFLQALFHSGSIAAEVTGNLRQKYRGELPLQTNAFDQGLSAALAPAFFAIAYPLYIGISRGLRGRLGCHKEQLEAAKTQHLYEPGPGDTTDDEAESRNFGQRLGAVFRKAEFLDTSSLFIKCVAYQQAGSGTEPYEVWLEQVMVDIAAAERTCNTLFHPVFGRR